MVLDLWERKFSQIYWVQISFQSMYVFFSSCTACMLWLNQLCGKVMLSWNETEVKKKFNFSDICIKWDCTVSENKLWSTLSACKSVLSFLSCHLWCQGLSFNVFVLYKWEKTDKEISLACCEVLGFLCFYEPLYMKV